MSSGLVCAPHAGLGSSEDLPGLGFWDHGRERSPLQERCSTFLSSCSVPSLVQTSRHPRECPGLLRSFPSSQGGQINTPKIDRARLVVPARQG